MGRPLDWFRKIGTYGARAARSRNLLRYLGFVGMAAVFWCFMTFHKTMQQDVTVNVVLVNKPLGATFITDIPSTLTVTVKDKGTMFLRMKFHRTPVLRLDFSRYADEDGNFIVSNDQLLSEIKLLFRQDASLIKVSPGSIITRFTLLPGKRVPVSYMGEINVQADEQHAIYGEISITPDSVTLYGDPLKLASITEAKLSRVDNTALDATLERDVPLAAITDVRIEPRKVRLRVPVEALIRRQQSIPVEVRNAPPGVHVILFPSSINASFLLPQSLYKSSVDEIVAVVDYNDIAANPHASKVHVNVGERRPYYHNIQLAVDSVEFIIEHDNHAD